MAKAKKVHYVNNKRLLEEMIEYRKIYYDAKEKGEQKPIIPNYIGECILLIATRLATKPNFYGYSYKEEMISDGIENCMNYLHNFDPEKSSNPFAYFTQIIYFAFLRRIQKEKKQVYIKHKSLENSMLMNELVETSDDVQFVVQNLAADKEKIEDLVNMFEPKLAAKAKKVTGIEKFIGEKDDD
jgi:hypothetical protein